MEEHLDNFVVAGAIKYKRGDYSIDYKLDLLAHGRHAPFITKKDVLDGKVDVDHYIPLDRGGKEDTSNQWLMFSEDNRSAQNKDKIVWWHQKKKPPIVCLRQWLKQKDLLFLTDRNLPDPLLHDVVSASTMYENVIELQSEEEEAEEVETGTA